MHESLGPWARQAEERLQLRQELAQLAAASSVSVSKKLLALDGPWPVPVLFHQKSGGNWSVDLTSGIPNAVFGEVPVL